MSIICAASARDLKGSRTASCPCSCRLQRLSSPSTEYAESDVGSLRESVMDVASIVNVLHNRADDLCDDAWRDHLYVELCTMATAVAGLSARLEWIAAQEQTRPCSVEPCARLASQNSLQGEQLTVGPTPPSPKGRSLHSRLVSLCGRLLFICLERIRCFQNGLFQ